MKMNKKTHFGYKEVDKKDKEVHVGNVFSSAWDGVQIFSPSGDLIAKILLPEQRTANLCFGGKYFNELFITSDKSLYTIDMNVRGNRN